MNTTDINTPHGVTSNESRPSTAPSSPQESADIVHRVAKGAHASIDQLQRGVTSGMEQARVSADQWSGSVRETVREHPLASVGGAFALGVIFARLMR